MFFVQLLWNGQNSITAVNMNKTSPLGDNIKIRKHIVQLSDDKKYLPSIKPPV